MMCFGCINIIRISLRVIENLSYFVMKNEWDPSLTSRLINAVQAAVSGTIRRGRFWVTSCRLLWLFLSCCGVNTWKGVEPPSLTWDRGAQCHEHHSGDRVLQANSAAKMWCQVPDDSGQKANDTHGDSKAGPAAPVVGGRHQSEQDFPEDGHEVTRVVQPGWRFLRTVPVLIVIVIISWLGSKTERKVG